MTLARFDHVLDTSAILAVILGEPEGTSVVDLLEDAKREKTSIGLPFIALMESEYKLLRLFTADDVTGSLRLVHGWPALVVESNEDWCHEAARIKASGGLSLADAWVAALAVLTDARLVHMDPEFERVPSLKSMRL